MTDERVVSARRRQLEGWRSVLDSGATRVGWKIGLNVPEVQRRLGIEEPVIGHLTSRTTVAPGGEYSAGSAERLHAEPEVAVEVGRAVDPGADEDTAREAIAGLAPAIELVDLGAARGDLEAIVAGNIFHRAVILGSSRPAFAPEGVRATITVSGEERGAAESPEDFADVVLLTARLLGAAGERLSPGDRIIAGAITPPVPVQPGDDVSLDLGPLGTLDVRIRR